VSVSPVIAEQHGGEILSLEDHVVAIELDGSGAAGFGTVLWREQLAIVRAGPDARVTRARRRPRLAACDARQKATAA
jgi:hypothetical protein